MPIVPLRFIEPSSPRVDRSIGRGRKKNGARSSRTALPPGAGRAGASTATRTIGCRGFRRPEFPVSRSGAAGIRERMGGALAIVTTPPRQPPGTVVSATGNGRRIWNFVDTHAGRYAHRDGR